MPTEIELRRQEQNASQRVRELRREVFERGDFSKMAALAAEESELQRISNERIAAERDSNSANGRIVAVEKQMNLLGPNTTGISIDVKLRMKSIPTALVHLFEAETQPLVEFEMRNHKPKTKRLRLISYVEGYSAKAIDTIELTELQPEKKFQLPTFFPQSLAAVTELTRASVNVEVQDLDHKTEIHRTVPVWLLARTTAPLQVQDPANGKWIDMTKYLGAFVTPNAPAIMEYLQLATQKHPEKHLVGYQIGESHVSPQVQAIYDALATSGIRYVNSVIDFTPEKASQNQRVRLPSESLKNKSANCIDGTVLMASLLEAVSLNPAIVIIPGHAFLGWETWRDSGVWKFVETTVMSTHTFPQACQRGEEIATQWQQATQAKGMFKILSLRELRAIGITPLE